MPPHGAAAPAAPPQTVLLAAFVLLPCIASVGLLSEVQATREGEQLTQELAALIKLSGDAQGIDASEAKRLGSDLLRIALQSQLGCLCAAGLVAFSYAAVALVAKALFLGRLSVSEHAQSAERLVRFMYIKSVTVVGSGVYGDQTQWVAWTAATCLLVVFTRLGSLRGEALLSNPTATLWQHARIVLLLTGILAQAASFAAAALGNASPSHALLYLYDAAFLAIDASCSLALYSLHAADHALRLRADARGEEREPWEGRMAASHWLTLGQSVSLHALTLAHTLHVWWLHVAAVQRVQLVDGLLLLQVRSLLVVLQSRLASHARYRRLERALRGTFPDADPGQLADDRCPICLGAMRAAKQLPCRHVVHASCLCAWVQHSQSADATCPMCRAPLDIRPLPHKRLAWPRQLAGAAVRLLRPPTAEAAASASHPEQPADERASVEVETPPGGRGSRSGANRPLTRLQARLAAAAARGSPGPPTFAVSPEDSGFSGTLRSSPHSGRRRIDGMLD